MAIRTNAISSETVSRSDKFWDEPALSAFSDSYVAAFSDNTMTAYRNVNYNDTTWTDNISSTTATRTEVITAV